MRCHSPTVAYRFLGVNPDTGKPYKPYKFVPFKDDATFLAAVSRPLPNGYERLVLPCGRCLLCTRRYRKMWALRVLHELRGYEQSSFLTLTVDDVHIDSVFPRRPFSAWHSLSIKPWQDFMKRLRRHLDYHRIPYEQPLRFYMCGEYGDVSHRPHYHVILFGWCPSDLVPLVGHKGLYISATLARLWPYGYHTVGVVNSDRASYVAGYCDKKLDANRMVWVDNDVAPEFINMSRGCKSLGTGGIGKAFWDKYHDTDLYPQNDDGTFVRTCAVDRSGYYVQMPRYYDNLLLLHDPEKYAMMLASRKVGVCEMDIDYGEWLNESHLKHEVARAKRKKRETGVYCCNQVQSSHVA